MHTTKPEDIYGIFSEDNRFALVIARDSEYPADCPTIAWATDEDFTENVHVIDSKEFAKWKNTLGRAE